MQHAKMIRIDPGLNHFAVLDPADNDLSRSHRLAGRQRWVRRYSLYSLGRLSGHRHGVATAARHVTARIHMAPDTIVAMVLAGGIINAEDNEFTSSVAIQIGHGNSATLILGAKPAGKPNRVGPATGHLTGRIQS